MWDAEVAKKIDHSMKTWGQDQFPNWLASEFMRQFKNQQNILTKLKFRYFEN